MQHLGSLVFELVYGHTEFIDVFGNHDVFGLQDDFLKSLLQLSVAFPKLGIKVVENFESVVSTKLHLHFEELFIVSQFLDGLLGILQLLVPFDLFVD